MIATQTFTAAGTMIEVFDSGRAPSRGHTTVWFGRVEDGRFAVASRFQRETITQDRARAARTFRRFVPED